MPNMAPTYPSSMAGMQTSKWPMKTARMARPGLRPLLTDVEATWYMEIEKASATQNPSKEGHVHVRSGDPRGMGSCSLLVEIWSSEWFEYDDCTARRLRRPMMSKELGDRALSPSCREIDKERSVLEQYWRSYYWYRYSGTYIALYFLLWFHYNLLPVFWWLEIGMKHTR